MVCASVPCGLMDDLLSLNYKDLQNIKLVGIDLDDESLKLGAENAKKHNIAFVDSLKKDAWDMGVNNEYDLLTSNGLNIYEKDDKRVIELYKSFWKALKPGGVLITSFLTPPPALSKESPWKEVNTQDAVKQKAIFSDIIQTGWQSFRTEVTTKQQLEQAGFRDIEFIYDRQHMFPTVIAKKMNITFRKVTPQDIDTIYGWLAEPHVMEFWDNSDEHQNDILNFAQGRKEPSSYFGGNFVYWIGFCDDKPFAFLLSIEENEKANPPEYMNPYLSKTGHSIGLDFCIGNPNYIGKGLAAPTLQAFMKFYTDEIDPKADTYFIDPSDTNPRAIHVYEKAGFAKVTDFVAEKGYFNEQKGLLMVKTVQ